MRRLSFVLLLAVFGAGAAQAATCDESFTKRGNPLGGQTYVATAAIGGATPVVALRQFRGIAVASGYDVIVDEAAEGSLLIEQPRSGAARPIPIIATAVAEGASSTVRLEAKLPAGMIAKSEDVRSELCGMLNRIVGGKAGIAAAGQGEAAVSAAPPRKVDALVLSIEITQEAAKNAAIIPARYKGKSFTISGRVDYVIADAGTYRVAYDIPETTSDLVLKVGKFHVLTDISCLVARGQSALALTLKKGDRVTLTGAYRDFDEFKNVMWFENCRPS